MELIILIILIISLLLVLAFIFNFNLKKVKQVAKDDNLDEITKKLPENTEICKTMLHIVKGSAKIEDNLNSNTSLYIVASNKILIGNVKDSFTRVQTIAHECLHSIQDKKILMFNFIYSNIFIIYYILCVILTIVGVYKNDVLHTSILCILGFVFYCVRSFLETDAMTKAKYLAKEYLEEVKIISKEEENLIIDKYGDLNRIGIPATMYSLLLSLGIMIVIYMCICKIF